MGTRLGTGNISMLLHSKSGLKHDANALNRYLNPGDEWLERRYLFGGNLTGINQDPRPTFQ